MKFDSIVVRKSCVLHVTDGAHARARAHYSQQRTCSGVVVRAPVAPGAARGNNASCNTLASSAFDW
jgi:hypothetical protein